MIPTFVDASFWIALRDQVIADFWDRALAFDEHFEQFGPFTVLR